MSFLAAIKQRRPDTDIDPKDLCKGEKYDINLQGCGHGNYGRLAQANLIPLARFTRCKALNKIKFSTIATGAAHILGLDTNGSLYTWGKCHYGQLGHGQKDTDRWLPTLVDKLKDVKITAIGAGDSTAFAVSAGKIYGWGCGFYGALGHGNETSFSTPKVIEALKDDVVSVTGGGFHTVVVSKSAIYSFGKNERGQLGLGDCLNRNVPNKINSKELFKEQDLSSIQVACGLGHTVLVKDGCAYSTGDNSTGQLGIDKKVMEVNLFSKMSTSNVIAAAASKDSTIILQKDGTVVSVYNQGGKVKTAKKVVSIAAGEKHYLALDTEGSVWTWGESYKGKLGRNGEYHKPGIAATKGKVVQVAAGSNHSFVLTKE